MSGEDQEWERLIEELRAENSELKRQAEDRQNDLQHEMEEVNRLQQKLDESSIRAELERLRALESLREEHQLALRREQELADYERSRANRLDEEKSILVEKLAALKANLSTPAAIAAVGGSSEHSGVTAESGGGTTESSANEDEEAAASSASAASTPEDTVERRLVEPRGTGSEGSPAATEAEEAITGGIPATTEQGESVLATVSRLLQAQTEALAAQTRVAAAQHLLPLKPFTGEGMRALSSGLSTLKSVPALWVGAKVSICIT